MIRPTAISWLLALAGLTAAPDKPDILRFSNGDQLHGSFQGIREGARVVWQREDLSEPVEFKTARLRHVVLHGGRPIKALTSLSNVGLVNGDRVPGTVTGMDGDSIILDTSFAGVLRIPIRQVAMLCPNPLGGRVYYHGPFIEEEWEMAHPSLPGGLPAEKAGEVAAEDQPGRWLFSGSAWYWPGKLTPGTALLRRSGLPDRSVLSFNLAWKNQFGLVVAFYADFTRPKPMDDEKFNEKNKGAKSRFRGMVPGDLSQLPRVFGNSYVLQLYPNYIMLNRTRVDENGNPSFRRIQCNNNSIRINNKNQARIELRSNRLTGAISLFIDEEFAAQWNDNDAADAADDKPSGHGSGYGFMVQDIDASVRVSDIIVTEWNGMPDSARSLQSDDQDIILMSNGTDRFAGRVGKLDDQGKVLFKGRHGDLQVPLDEIAEIRFARNRLAPAAEEAAENLTIRFSPMGTISGRPQSGDGAVLQIDSPILGKLKVLTESAVFLDFNASKQKIDDWYVEF